MDNIIDTNLIEEYMIKNNMSKKEFCARCKISTHTFDKICKQQTDYNIIALFKIARLMNLHIKDLFVK
ncbi:MAG: helix-turn-helix transcriptional regulator [Clostridia bacterium]|nr:helix-turn-helix transcriptional regulator [Clostridia bacterium]